MDIDRRSFFLSAGATTAVVMVNPAAIAQSAAPAEVSNFVLPRAISDKVALQKAANKIFAEFGAEGIKPQLTIYDTAKSADRADIVIWHPNTITWNNRALKTIALQFKHGRTAKIEGNTQEGGKRGIYFSFAKKGKSARDDGDALIIKELLIEEIRLAEKPGVITVTYKQRIMHFGNITDTVSISFRKAGKAPFSMEDFMEEAKPFDAFNRADGLNSTPYFAYRLEEEDVFKSGPENNLKIVMDPAGLAQINEAYEANVAATKNTAIGIFNILADSGIFMKNQIGPTAPKAARQRKSSPKQPAQ